MQTIGGLCVVREVPNVELVDAELSELAAKTRIERQRGCTGLMWKLKIEFLVLIAERHPDDFDVATLTAKVFDDGRQHRRKRLRCVNAKVQSTR